MAAISKFLFETSFEAHRAGDAPPPPVRRAFTPAELEAARAEGHAEGVEAGQAAAHASIEARTADALAALAGKLAALLKDAAAAEQTRTHEAIAAMATIARKLMPGLSERHGLSEVEALLLDCLGRLHDEPRVVVRINDALLDVLKEKVDALATSIGFAGRIIVIADPAVAAGDARIEWADGGAERDSARAWADIDGLIARFIETWPQGRQS
jgi:flagellar assembly protein FliH